MTGPADITPPRPLDMRALIKEHAERAVFLAEDGAYRSALRTLKALVNKVQAHVDYLDQERL